MEIITITGTIIKEAEICTDKNGKQYVRFKVSSNCEDIYGEPKFNHYCCTYYSSDFFKLKKLKKELKKGHQVMLCGQLKAKVEKKESGNVELNMNINVAFISIF